ncbi:MAG: papain-like cysteine protease family protein [Myxococcota bacterium]
MAHGTGALTIGAILSLSSAAHADTTCAPRGEDGVQRCQAGIKSEMIEATVATVGGQLMSQWCWAASISMVFRYYGYEVSQQRIVAETFGQVVNMPGSAEQIMQALDRTWTDDRGRSFRVSADASSASPDSAVADLAASHPLIVGTQGHAMVLTALGYAVDPWNGDQITSAIVRDPWPGNGRRELSGEEWNGADLLVRISVTPIDGAPVAHEPARRAPVMDERAPDLEMDDAPSQAPTNDDTWSDDGWDGDGWDGGDAGATDWNALLQWWLEQR